MPCQDGGVAPVFRVDEVKLLRESENGDRVYSLAIFGHDYGGMSCHESDDRTLLGSAVVDLVPLHSGHRD